MKKFFAEFGEFIKRGNVLDLAVGVIIGGAFQAIVTSLIDNIISPILGFACKMNFDSLTADFNFGDTEVVLKYGAFITAVINFLIMAFVVFLIVKGVNRLTSLRKKEEEAPAAPTTKKCPFCCSEIPIEATRCPHCTSLIEEAEKAE